ncbi:MAG TPA: class I SAM-dependent methyltransferase [Methylomirabilota bacterium]|nr:class I SAM-dependent methyltransferase [Methylomirabilota bacterium]
MTAMTEQAERYDRIATGYARWWAPIIAPQAVGVLAHLEPAIAGGARRIVDIGTGTGTLAIAALRRWPDVEVVGVDASSGMAEVAAAEADRLLDAADRRRFDTRVAFADEMPFADGQFDVAMSSFVFQLVPNRFRALREAHRVLRSGGTLAYVSWLADERAFGPDADFDAALEEIGIGARDWDDRPGDIESVPAAVAQMRRAGFSGATAEAGLLEHPFDVEGYVGFMTTFDEEDLVRSLEPDEQDALLAGLRRRLRARPAADLVLRLSTVTARGTRP